MSKRLVPIDWRMLKDNAEDGPVTDGVLTFRLGGTAIATAVWYDKDLTQPTTAGVSTINCDTYGWPSADNNEVEIWGNDDTTYDMVAQGTGYNGSLPRTFANIAVADTTTTDDTASELALGNGFDNGAFDAWSSGSSFSNISGDGDGDETADGWFFTQPNAASNAISRQDGFAIGADAVEQRYSYRFGRPAASNSTNELRLWRLIRPEIAFRFRNKEVTLRFSVKAGANYSGAGGSLGVRLATGTAENEDGDLIDSGGFAGQQNPIDQSVSVSATAQRYELTVTLGATIKEIGLQFSYTGVGIAGAADYVTIQDVELKDATDSEEYASRPEALEFLLSTTLSADLRALMRTANDAAFRTELGLGTAATQNTGTSGANVPLLNGANTWSAAQVFSAIGTFNSDLNLATGSDNYVYYDGNLHLAQNGVGDAITIAATTRVATFAARPVFNGNTALDTNNGAQLTAANAFTNDNTIAGVHVGGGNLIAGNYLHHYFSSNIAYTRALENGVGWREYQLDGSPLKLNSNSLGDVTLPGLVAPTSIYSAGFRGSPVVSGNSAYAFPATDAGSTIYHDEAGTRTYTIPANASVPHPIGTMYIISNTGNSGAAGTITLAITTDTLRRADGVSGTGSRTIAANQKAVLEKVTSTIWELSGGFS